MFCWFLEFFLLNRFISNNAESPLGKGQTRSGSLKIYLFFHILYNLVFLTPFLLHFVFADVFVVPYFLNLWIGQGIDKDKEF